MTGGDASAAAKSLIKVLFFIRRSSRISGGVLGHSPRGKIGDFPRGASCCDRTTANDNVFLSYLIQHRTSCPRCRLDRHRGGGHPPTPATPPCVRVRTRRFETVTLHSSTKVGSPRDLKYALESPTVRALVRAIGQGPRPLLAVLRARRGETPSFKRAARRRRGVFHCRHRAARSRNRTQRVR